MALIFQFCRGFEQRLWRRMQSSMWVNQWPPGKEAISCHGHIWAPLALCAWGWAIALLLVSQKPAIGLVHVTSWLQGPSSDQWALLSAKTQARKLACCPKSALFSSLFFWQLCAYLQCYPLKSLISFATISLSRLWVSLCRSGTCSCIQWGFEIWTLQTSDFPCDECLVCGMCSVCWLELFSL